MFKKLKNSKKGFTLAELLIVVAIIGVLVAISIPIFTSQLEKSRDAVTLSNLRAAYAQAQSAYLTQSSDNADATKATVVYTAPKDSAEATVVVKKVVSKGQDEGLNGLDELAWLTDAERKTLAAKDSLGGKAQNWDITFTYNADGSIKSVEAAASK